MKFNLRDFLNTIIIIVLLIYIYINRKEKVDYDFDSMNKKIELLQKSNDSLINDVALKKKEIEKINQSIDSLESLKTQTITKYKYINNEIDKANFTELVSKFDSIFTNSGIK